METSGDPTCGQLQTEFADGNEVKTTRALFLKNTSGTTSLEELTNTHLKVIHGRVAQKADLTGPTDDNKHIFEKTPDLWLSKSNGPPSAWSG